MIREEGPRIINISSVELNGVGAAKAGAKRNSDPGSWLNITVALFDATSGTPGGTTPFLLSAYHKR